MDTQLKKGALEMCVLHLLSTKDRYGYEIVQEISRGISVTEGTIYPLLRRLKDEQLVSTYLVESTEGPSRKYYKITADGKKVHKKLTAEWHEFAEKINAIIK